LEFDYVSTARPSKGVQALSERRFSQLIRELAKECYYIVNLDENKENAEVQSIDPSESSSLRAKARWKLLREEVKRRKLAGLVHLVKAKIFRIKNSKDEIRLKLAEIESVVFDRYLTVNQVRATFLH